MLPTQVGSQMFSVSFALTNKAAVLNGNLLPGGSKAWPKII